MQVLIVSDVHGSDEALGRALYDCPLARVVFCLGDGVREYEAAQAREPARDFCIVRGNCDFSAGVTPATAVREIEGHRILCLHGHLHGVKQSLLRAEYAARERGADILLFGHTHVPYGKYHDGLYLCNPGSLGYDGWYALAEISRDAVRFEKRNVR